MAPVAVNFIPSKHNQQPKYVGLDSATEKIPFSAVPPGLASAELVLPPGLMDPVSPPKPLADPTQRVRICYFQNRYHHQKPGDDFKRCTAGDDCEFCHAFHPRMKRRNDPKTIFCTCPDGKCSGSDTASTAAGLSDDTSASEETCDTSSSCSDPSPKTFSTHLSASAHEFVPLDVEEARREAQMNMEKLLKAMHQPPKTEELLDKAAEDFLLRKLRSREAQKKFVSRLAPTSET